MYINIISSYIYIYIIQYIGGAVLRPAISLAWSAESPTTYVCLYVHIYIYICVCMYCMYVYI